MTGSGGGRGVLKRPVLSPLRYPGGKGTLYQDLLTVVRANNLLVGSPEPAASG